MTRLVSAGISPETLGAGASLAAVAPSPADIGVAAAALAECDLESAVYGDLVVDAPRAVDPSTVSCMPSAMAADPGYSLEVAESMFLGGYDGWLGAYDASFARAAARCPEGFGGVIVGRIEDRVGLLPDDVARCLQLEFAKHVGELTSGDRDRVTAAADSADAACANGQATQTQILDDVTQP